MSSFYDFYCFVYWTSTACTAYSLTGWTSSCCLNKYLGLLWKHGVRKQTLCEACNLAQSLSFPVRIEQGSNRARTWTSLVFLCINSSRFWLLLKTKRFLVKKMPFFLRCNKHISRLNLNVMPDMGGNRKMDREKKRQSHFVRLERLSVGTISKRHALAGLHHFYPESLWIILQLILDIHIFRLWPSQQDNLPGSDFQIAHISLSLSPVSGHDQ